MSQNFVQEGIMEPLFQEFRNYKFEDDLNYQNGIQKLNSKPDNSSKDQVGGCSKTIKDSLETRHFYWSKFFQSFDLNQYKEWISKLSKVEDVEAACNNTKANSDDVEAAPAEEKSLSFQEIIEMVQKGESVPGIRMIPDVVHSQKEPSKSSLQPIKKPWEKK
jgi:hypothetical protein